MQFFPVVTPTEVIDALITANLPIDSTVWFQQAGGSSNFSFTLFSPSLSPETGGWLNDGGITNPDASVYPTVPVADVWEFITQTRTFLDLGL